MRGLVGAERIGLAAVVTARLYSPAHIVVIDKADSPLQAAKMVADPVRTGSLRGVLSR